jgi:hypothetical protein
MLKKLEVRKLSQAGLSTDALPSDLPPNFLTDLRNVRLVARKIQNYKGSRHLDALPAGFVPGYIMNVNDPTGAYWVIAGDNEVYTYDGTNFVARAAGPVSVISPIEWSGCQITNIPIVNHPQDFPQFWIRTAGATFEYLLFRGLQPWNNVDWSAVGGPVNGEERARIIRSHKQYLFALDLTSDDPNVGRAPAGVRWSAPADIGSVPVQWDPYDTTNVAGVTDLGGEGGQIIDGFSLRDSFVVYRQSAISVFDFKGGPFVWQIRNVSTTFGLINEDCLVEVNGKHYFIGRDDIYEFDGHTVKPLLDDVIQGRFITEFDIDNFFNAFVVKYDILDEIWFCIPVEGTATAFATAAYVLNWRDNTWTIIDLPYGIARHAAYGTYTIARENWENAVGNWTQYFGPWLTGGSSPVVSTLLAIQGPGESPHTTEGALTVIDPGDRTYDETPNRVFIERVGIPFEGLTTVTTITRVYPIASGDADLAITVGSQDHPNAPVRWKQPVMFNPSKDRKVDVRTTGELHAYRVEYINPGNAESFSLTGLDFEYSEAGAR